MRTNLLKVVGIALTAVFICSESMGQSSMWWDVPLCQRFEEPVPFFPDPEDFWQNEWMCKNNPSNAATNPHDWRPQQEQVAVWMNFSQWLHTGEDDPSTGYVQMKGIQLQPEVDTLQVRARVYRPLAHLGYTYTCDCVYNGPGTMTVWIKFYDHYTGELLHDIRLEELFETQADWEDPNPFEQGAPPKRVLLSLLEGETLRQVGLVDIEFGFAYESEYRSSSWIWFMSEFFDQWQNADGNPVRTEDLVAGSDLRLEAYPNPARDLLNIEIDDLNHNGTHVVLYDLLGREVNRAEVYPGLAAVRFDVSRLPSGTYVVAFYAHDRRLAVRRITVL